MRDLIGRKFKRNKYGLSTWTDTITDVWIRYNFDLKHSFEYATPQVMVRGKMFSYPIE